jgi:lipoprotein-anchoring transpeptidase ErfK/SrfK
MKGRRSSLERLCSTALCLGATLTMATFAVLSLPTFADKALSHSRYAQQRGDGRWIEVDLSRQQLVAWNGKNIERIFWVSTGKRSTPTLSGTYSIQSKYRVTRMQGADYNIPDVPYTMYYSGGYALHGAYWHNSFGTRVSHGCVNLGVRQARWLYNWAPVGTTVVVHR